MATIILSGVGTLIGGPIGGAVGAIIGQQIDQNILFKPKTREGPRLQDLAIQTSQYGRQVPKVYGSMRVAGTVIWATDLQETSKKEGGGKGRPSTRTYSYSVSFAVALSSRPIKSIGRIWAEGNLLRGTGGDFKTPVTFRFHDGYGDQQPDPLLASAEAAGEMPAHRRTAYAVFEDMELADYGNRIPSLTVEVIADNGAITLHDIVAVDGMFSAGSILPQPLSGFAASGSDIRALLSVVDNALPLSCSVDEEGIRVSEAMQLAPASLIIKRDDIVRTDTDNEHGHDPVQRIRTNTRDAAPDLALRYYDPARDYQTGLRHARHGQAGQKTREIDLPAVLDASAAQLLADNLYRYGKGGQSSLRLAIAHIDEGITPGTLVRVEGETGIWRVVSWQWREDRVFLNLALHSIVVDVPAQIDEQPGQIIAPADVAASASLMHILDLPPFYGEPNIVPRQFAALAGQSEIWRGAQIFGVAENGDMTETGIFARQPSIMGSAAQALPSASAHIADMQNSLDITVQHSGMQLFGASPDQLAAGANLALVGEEIIQFGVAENIAAGTYRLSCLWRGRGGTEYSVGGHSPNEAVILLDDSLIELPASASEYNAYAAVGQGDETPYVAPAPATLRSVRPFSPAHPATELGNDDVLEISWIRRSREGYAWRDYVDVPLGEEDECYTVRLFAGGAQVFVEDTAMTSLSISASIIQGIRNNGHSEIDVSVEQKGRFTLSQAKRITAVTI